EPIWMFAEAKIFDDGKDTGKICPPEISPPNFCQEISMSKKFPLTPPSDMLISISDSRESVPDKHASWKRATQIGKTGILRRQAQSSLISDCARIMGGLSAINFNIKPRTPPVSIWTRPSRMSGLPFGGRCPNSLAGLLSKPG